MRIITATTVALSLGLGGAAQPLSPRIPKASPWLVLAHDPGLSASGSGGLVCAIWSDGTIVRRASGDRTGEAFELTTLATAQLDRVREAVARSRIAVAQSAQRYLDLPEDSLVIRANGKARCWYDTPGVEVTPGLAQIREAVSQLELARPTNLKLQPQGWLPWSAYWEQSCKS
jgi:hypothetical protein